MPYDREICDLVKQSGAIVSLIMIIVIKQTDETIERNYQQREYQYGKWIVPWRDIVDEIILFSRVFVKALLLDFQVVGLDEKLELKRCFPARRKDDPFLLIQTAFRFRDFPLA